MNGVNNIVYERKDKRNEDLGNQVPSEEHFPKGPDEKAYCNKEYGIYSKTPF